MNFADRIDAAVAAKGNPCVVGLDPHLELLPPAYAAAHDPRASRAERASAVESFLLASLDAVADIVPAVKPQSAFFEALGADGARVWESVVAAAHDAGLVVIGDVKRGDIGSTARAYVRAHLAGLPGDDPRSLCDAVTINAFLGSDSVAPYLAACEEHGKGIFVLVRTSNPSSAEFQAPRHGDSASLSDTLADAVEAWGAELVGASGYSSVGAVVGATHPTELAALRARMPRAWLLIPGYGAQGGTARDVSAGFDANGRGALVAASRSVLFAGRTLAARDQRDAQRQAARTMASEIRAALGSDAR